MAASKRRDTEDLIDAAKRGDVVRAKSLIDDGCDVNGKNYSGLWDDFTALHAASGAGHADVAEVLIKHGADVNAKDWNRFTSLHAASKEGHADVVEVLIKHFANVNAKDRNKFTALHSASKEGHAAVVEVLIKHVADVNAKDRIDSTAMHAASGAGHADVVEVLIKHVADVNAKDRNGDTPLHLAAFWGYEKTTKLLLEHKASVDTQNNDGDTPLNLAVRHSMVEMTKLLFEHKASVEIQNKKGDTPLDTMVKHYKEYVKESDNKEQNRCLRFIIVCLSLVPAGISIKTSLKKMEKLGKFVIDSPDVDTPPVDICDAKASSTLTSWYKEGHTASVMIFSDNTALSKLSDKLQKKHVISSIILFDVDMKNVKKVPISHAVCLFSIGSFDHEKVMSWCLPSVKIFKCVDNNIIVPWSIKLSFSLDILNVSFCTLKVEKRTPASHENVMKYIHVTCDSVKQLILNDNGFTSLQEDIGSMPGLEVLNVCNNSIQRIPPSLCKLADIPNLNIEGNPSVNIPPDIIGKGREAICSYLKDFLDSNVVPKNNVKVILLGHEGVGKTTLVKAISGTDAKNVYKTDGITVSKMHLGKCDINLTFFDFAGDVDFLESHSLFITDDSVFLVVFDLSKFAIGNSIHEISSLHQLGRVRLWLQTIFSYAPNSSVLLVGTHADAEMLNKDVLCLIWNQFKETLSEVQNAHHLYYKNSARGDCLVCEDISRLERKALKSGLAGYVKIRGSHDAFAGLKKSPSECNDISSFPHVIGYFEVCSTDNFPKGMFVRGNKSISQFKAELTNVCKRVIAADPDIPERWHCFRESLKSERETRRNPIMSYREYQELSYRMGITQKTSLDNVTSFLCSQGEIVVGPFKSVGDHREGIIVLDPQWLADKLRTLITYERDGQYEEVYIDERGILSGEKMTSWIDKDKDHRSLLEVFEAMHVCFSFGEICKPVSSDSSRNYLFPCKLPVGQPSHDDWNPYPNSKVKEKHANLLFRFEFLPPLFFCDLVVCVHSRLMSNSDNRPKYTRNNIVFFCYEVFQPCENCRTDLGEICKTRVPHLVRFELLYHSNSILASAKGPRACCAVHHLGKILRDLKMKPLYRNVVMEPATEFACPYCIVKRKRKIGIMKNKDNVYGCSEALDHKFYEMESLLLYQGVDRIDFTKLMKDIHEDTQCPSFFIMLPLNIGSMSVLDQIAHWVQSHFYDGYAVHLLCEWPKQLHFINSPGYRIRNVKGFIKKYGKHVLRVLNIIQKVGCLLSFIPGPQSAPTSKAANIAGEANALLSDAVNDFCNQYPELGKIREETLEKSTIELEKSKEGLRRREFQRFLGKKDEDSQFGGLYPINHGERIIWVCEEHGEIYKPS